MKEDKKRNKLHSLKVTMIIVDIFFIPLFIMELKFNMVHVVPYVVLLIVNIFVFLAKLK